MVANCASYNGNGDAFLKEKYGINLDNNDTGAITGGASTSITLIDKDDKQSSSVYGSASGKTLTVTKNVTLSSSYQSADASKLMKSVQITGNALNN